MLYEWLIEGSADQVKTDADLVWSNCLRYNRRPIDQPTRDVCNEVKDEFERLWAEADLAARDGTVMPTSTTKNNKQAIDTLQISEKDVPDEFNIIKGVTIHTFEHH